MTVEMVDCVALNIATGEATPMHGEFRQWHEDAHILSFSTLLSAELMERLEKRACVRLLGLLRLKSAIDRQMGMEGQYGPVEYTASDRRGHFTKGEQAAFQSEYRIAWLTGGGPVKWVTVPAKTAKRVM